MTDLIRSPEYLALLAGVCRHPEDDLRRLVFADWMDGVAGYLPCPHCGGGRPGEWFHAVGKNGACDTCRGTGRVSDGLADRAEFIRLGLDNARTCGDTCPARPPHYRGCPRRREAKRAEHLLRKHSRQWEGAAAACESNVWRRGFLDEVRLTLAQFAGGACGRCNGHGRYADCSEAECTHCGGVSGTGKCGTGRTPGLAESLFREQPVTRVVLVDKQPLNNEGVASYFDGDPRSPPDAWFWVCGDGPVERMTAWEVPASIAGRDVPSFDSERAADDWLSGRCVQYARRLAFPDLPELV